MKKHALFGPDSGHRAIGQILYLDSRLPSGVDYEKVANLYPLLCTLIPKLSIFVDRRLPYESSQQFGYRIISICTCISASLWQKDWKQSGPFGLLDRKFEPDFVRLLPERVRALLRANYARTDGTDPLGIMPDFPLMGFGYLIPLTDFHRDIFNHFRLARLQWIRQLGYLREPIGSSGIYNLDGVFPQNRLTHSYDVHAIANLLANQIDLSPRKTTELAVAALSHDCLTPAGGDSIKAIAPADFDEDRHYPEMLTGETWTVLARSSGLDGKSLSQTILGQKLTGRILDLADKIAYTARDVQGLLDKLTFDSSLVNRIKELVQKGKVLAKIWQAVGLVVIEGVQKMVLTDPNLLEDFLTLRALMFRNLYQNPTCRVVESFLGRGVLKHLYEKGNITREALLTMRDQELDAWLSDNVGIEELTLFTATEHARVENFQDAEASLQRQNEINRDPDLIAVFCPSQRTNNHATSKFLTRRRQRIGTYRDLFPEQASAIEALTDLPQVFHIITLCRTDLRIGPKEMPEIKKMICSCS